MRILMHIRLPNAEFNAAVKNGTISQTINRILEECKPEAAYFTEEQGQRACIMVVDLEDPSKIPFLAEPWFLTLNASVELRVVMNRDDLKRAGLEELGRKWVR